MYLVCKGQGSPLTCLVRKGQGSPLTIIIVIMFRRTTSAATGMRSVQPDGAPPRPTCVSSGLPSESISYG